MTHYILSPISAYFVELPDLLPLKDTIEALLRVKYGPWLLCRLIGNAPDCFEQGL